MTNGDTTATTLSTSFYCDLDLADRQIGAGAVLAFPDEQGNPPQGCVEPLPEDPIHGSPIWAGYDDDGAWFVQGLVVLGSPAPAPDAGRGLRNALLAFGLGGPGKPAHEAAILAAWTRASAGDPVPLAYQLLTDAQQALAASFPERAVLEAGIAVEVAITMRYREERLAQGGDATEIGEELNNERGIYKRSRILAPHLSLALPDAESQPKTNGGFPRLMELKDARNSVGHTGRLPSGVDAADILGAGRALVDLCASDPWTAPAP